MLSDEFFSRCFASEFDLGREIFRFSLVLQERNRETLCEMQALAVQTWHLAAAECVGSLAYTSREASRFCLLSR